MIIWINGAWGAGKTQTCAELYRRTERSFLYDAENAGYFLRKNQPSFLHKEDFQDDPLWREISFKMLLSISQNYDGIIIVPMTIVNPQYYKEIISKLRENNISVFHFVLYAEKETLKKRLRKRFEFKNSWAYKRIDICLKAFENEIFENKIYTDKKGIPDVAEEIASILNIPLKKRDNAIKQKINMLKTQFNFIRKQ